MKDLATEMVRALFLAQIERESNPDCKRLQSSIVTNFTSSAYIVQWTPGGRYEGRSLMNSMKMSGPSTDPCGTPLSSEWGSD